MELQTEKNKRRFGAEGEDFAAQYLSCNDFKILCRNFRYGRMGEIDIIARENEYICFIEVKTRSNANFGAPCEAVNMRKQIKIHQLAMIYLKQLNLTDSYIRFDIAEVFCSRTGCGFKPSSINLIRNAF